ncbi:MAG: hypothetical protein QOG80_720, partial [Pseudonocardiales bacterium]|nr:hypothetical protein [Pseudonocardiales bacterium]
KGTAPMYPSSAQTVIVERTSAAA